MSKVYTNADLGNLSEEDNEDNLPYPKALPRSDFLSPDFDASTYLATLSDRHQTLEDLQSDLRERSKLLSKELLDLVNANYEQFLSLGSDLKGGEDRLEDVRVSLLGFKRGVNDVRGGIKSRKDEVEGLLEKKIDIGKQIALGRKLLEFDARLEELEDSLMIVSPSKPTNGVSEAFWDESEDDEGLGGEISTAGSNTGKLHRQVVNFGSIQRLMESIGTEHPFIQAQQSRISRAKSTILLDLRTALRQSRFTEKGKLVLLNIMGMYRKLGAAEEAVKILKDLKKS